MIVSAMSIRARVWKITFIIIPLFIFPQYKWKFKATDGEFYHTCIAAANLPLREGQRRMIDIWGRFHWMKPYLNFSREMKFSENFQNLESVCTQIRFEETRWKIKR